MLDSIAQPLLALAALIGAVFTIWKGVIPLVRSIRAMSHRAERALDVVLGTPAIPDPDRPGMLLRPAVPDMGVRMTAMETTVAALAMREEIQQAAKAASHAARDARLALKGVSDLRAAAEVWHADDMDVLTTIEARVAAAHPDAPTEPIPHQSDPEE